MEVSLGETFGQRRPPLSEMIRNILQEYASGQIFKVLCYFNTICMVNMRLQCPATRFITINFSVL